MAVDIRGLGPWEGGLAFNCRYQKPTQVLSEIYASRNLEVRKNCDSIIDPREVSVVLLS